MKKVLLGLVLLLLIIIGAGPFLSGMIAESSLENWAERMAEKNPEMNVELTQISRGYLSSEYEYTAKTKDGMSLLPEGFDGKLKLHHGPLPFSALGDDDAPFTVAWITAGKRIDFAAMDVPLKADAPFQFSCGLACPFTKNFTTTWSPEKLEIYSDDYSFNEATQDYEVNQKLMATGTGVKLCATGNGRNFLDGMVLDASLSIDKLVSSDAAKEERIDVNIENVELTMTWDETTGDADVNLPETVSELTIGKIKIVAEDQEVIEAENVVYVNSLKRDSGDLKLHYAVQGDNVKTQYGAYDTLNVPLTLGGVSGDAADKLFAAYQKMQTAQAEGDYETMSKVGREMEPLAASLLTKDTYIKLDQAKLTDKDGSVDIDLEVNLNDSIDIKQLSRNPQSILGQLNANADISLAEATVNNILRHVIRSDYASKSRYRDNPERLEKRVEREFSQAQKMMTGQLGQFVEQGYVKKDSGVYSTELVFENLSLKANGELVTLPPGLLE